MKNKIIIAILVLLSMCGNAFAGKISTRSTMPTECAVGDLWINPSGAAHNRIYTCTATDTWTLNAGSGGVTSVNAQTGEVVLDADDIDDTSTTNKFVTAAEKSGWDGKEDSLGNPSTNGYVLSSTTGGVRSWVEMTGGGTGIAHATADGNYYASKDGGWASLSGVFQSPLVAGTDYLTPTGSAASLTDFPTFNQNTTGSAATLTTPRTIAGTSFDGSANIDISYPNLTNKPTIPTVSDTAYDATSWNDNTDAPSKNAVRDEFERKANVSCFADASSFNACFALAWPTSSMTWPSAAGIMVYGGSSAYGNSLTLDADLSSVSASDDSVPSAKATKTALDSKVDNSFLGTAAQLNVGTSPGNVVQLGGACTVGDGAYTDQSTCEANSGQWVGVLSIICDSDTEDCNTKLDLISAYEVDQRIAAVSVMSHATSDGNYYASKDGAWASLYHVYQPYDANMIFWPSAISATEIEYLDGLTDTIVNLLAGKQSADDDLNKDGFGFVFNNGSAITVGERITLPIPWNATITGAWVSCEESDTVTFDLQTDSPSNGVTTSADSIVASAYPGTSSSYYGAATITTWNITLTDGHNITAEVTAAGGTATNCTVGVKVMK